MSKVAEKNINAAPTVKQLDLLQLLSGKNWRSVPQYYDEQTKMGLTRQRASEIISSLMDLQKTLGKDAAREAGEDMHSDETSGGTGGEGEDEGEDEGGEGQGEGQGEGEGEDEGEGEQEAPEQAQDDEQQDDEGEGPEAQADEQDEQQAAPQKGSSESLDDVIVRIVKARRDEVLEGIELGSSEGPVERKVVTIKRPDMPDVTVEGGHELFPDLVEVLGQGDHVMAVGPAGTGKTHSGKLAAKALGLEYTYWGANPRVTASILMGFVDATGGYVRTPFRDAYETGKVFILDEIDNGAPDLLTALNGAIENGEASFPDGLVKRHHDFVVFSTANTYGKGANRVYSGRQQLDGATLDRFITFDWGYDETLERKLAPCDDWTDYVQAIRKIVEQHTIREVVSMRAAIKGGKYLGLGWDWSRVEERILFRGWSADNLSKIESTRSQFSSVSGKYPGASKGEVN